MERWKFYFLSGLLAFYVLGLLLLTIGFFTPWWTEGYHRGPYLWNGHVLRLSFYNVLTAMILSHINDYAMLILAAFTCKMYKSEVFMSFLAVSCGVLYPIAGVLSVLGAGFGRVTHSKEVAYSSNACGFAGGINLMCYAALIWYDVTTSTQDRRGNNIVLPPTSGTCD